MVCSLCGKDDVEGNDVLLCDHAGCCRAYHQNCLSPAVIIAGMQVSCYRAFVGDACWSALSGINQNLLWSQ